MRRLAIAAACLGRFPSTPAGRAFTTAAGGAGGSVVDAGIEATAPNDTADVERCFPIVSAHLRTGPRPFDGPPVAARSDDAASVAIRPAAAAAVPNATAAAAAAAAASTAETTRQLQWRPRPPTADADAAPSGGDDGDGDRAPVGAPPRLASMLRQRLAALAGEAAQASDSLLPRRLPAESTGAAVGPPVSAVPRLAPGRRNARSRALATGLLEAHATTTEAEGTDGGKNGGEARELPLHETLARLDRQLHAERSSGVASATGVSGANVDADAASDGAAGLLPSAEESARGGVFLLRALQRAGHCSRRVACDVIAAGKITVNGTAERNPFRVVVAADDICVDGHSQRLRFAPTRLWALHKPSFVVVGARDSKGRRLFTRYAAALGHDHMIPIGSLPFRAHGLLLLTNDGELSRFLEHPETRVQSTWAFRVRPAIDPILSHKLNTEGLRVNGVTHRGFELAVMPSRKSRYAVRIKTRGRALPPMQLLARLGRRVKRAVRISVGPYVLRRLAPGSIREVAVPPFFMKYVGAAWGPFVERDWPYFRKRRVERLRRLAAFRTLSMQERRELDTFTFDELSQALAFDASEVGAEARRMADAIRERPHIEEPVLATDLLVDEAVGKW